MAEHDVQVVIDLVDNVSADIKAMRANMESQLTRANDKLKQSKGAFSDLGNEIKGNFVQAIKGAIVAYAGFEVINKVISTLKMARAEYQENYLAQNRLRFAIGGVSLALNQQAKVLGEKLKVDDTEITLAQAKIAAYIKTESQIKQIIPAILDLGAYLGSNEAAAQMLGRAFADDASELGRLKIQVDGATGSQERLNSIIQGVTKNFGGQSTAASEARDVWDAIGLTWKDANETLWTLMVNLSKGNKFAADDTQALVEAQYKLDKAIISTKKTFDGLEATPQQIQLALKRIEKYEWDFQMTRGKVALGAAMDRQENENKINAEKLAKQKEAHDKELAELRTHQQEMTDVQVNAFYAIEESKKIVAAENAQAQANTDELIQNSSLQRFNSFSEDFEAAEKARLDANIGLKRIYSEEEKAMAISATADQLGNLAALFEGQKKYIALYKTIAIAQATMDTYASAVSAYNSAVKVPIVGPILAPIAAGVAVASGIDNVRRIANTKFARGGVGQGGYAMIGEEGPEMMYVPSGARIYNSNETRNMTNNTNNNVTVNVMGGNGRVIETLRGSLRSGSGDAFVRDLKNALAVA